MTFKPCAYPGCWEAPAGWAHLSCAEHGVAEDAWCGTPDCHEPAPAVVWTDEDDRTAWTAYTTPPQVVVATAVEGGVVAVPVAPGLDEARRLWTQLCTKTLDAAEAALRADAKK